MALLDNAFKARLLMSPERAAVFVPLTKSLLTKRHNELLGVLFKGIRRK